MPLPENIDGPSPAELKLLAVKLLVVKLLVVKLLAVKLLEEVAGLHRTVAALREEIARLKGGPGRPNIKPSGMEQATNPKRP